MPVENEPESVATDKQSMENDVLAGLQQAL